MSTAGSRRGRPELRERLASIARPATHEQVFGLLSVEAQEVATERDRVWFEANPDADVRYRDLVPGELPLPVLPDGLEERLPLGAFQVEVIKLGPGLRTRRIASVDLTESRP